MICGSCGNQNAYRVSVKYDGKTGEKTEYCNQCRNMKTETIPDVYFREPYLDEHLASKEFPHGTFITSKRHKAEVMKKLKVREAGGDRNKILGRPQPFINDVDKRRKFFRDNFGEG